MKALLLPASARERCRILEIGYRAAELSDAIGGGLLADLYYGEYAVNPETPGNRRSGGFCIYADEDRMIKALPPNRRAEALVDSLGIAKDLDGIVLSGNVLVIGATIGGDDTDIPDDILLAARQAGLLSGESTDTSYREKCSSTGQDVNL